MKEFKNVWKNVKSVLQPHIAKRHFQVSLLWLCKKECTQVKLYICNLWEMTFEMKSILQSHIAHIAKSPFLISLLWLCMKECLPMKPYICTAVFVKWHLRWNKFCKHTLHTMQKGIFWYSYFGFARKNVCSWNPIDKVYVRWHLRWNQFCIHTCLFPKLHTCN